jgi:biotin operon repressor
MKQTEIMKEVGRLWNHLDPLEKKKYEVEANKGKFTLLQTRKDINGKSRLTIKGKW